MYAIVYPAWARVPGTGPWPRALAPGPRASGPRPRAPGPESKCVLGSFWGSFQIFFNDFPESRGLGGPLPPPD